MSPIEVRDEGEWQAGLSRPGRARSPVRLEMTRRKTEKAVPQVTGVRQWQGRPRSCEQPTLPAVVTAVTVTEPHLVPSAAGTTAG
jgi:hypothetical protein